MIRKQIIKGMKTVMVLLAMFVSIEVTAQNDFHVLGNERLKTYINYFNSIDTETVINYVPNKDAYGWIEKNVPLFECPDTTIEKIYYYRAWTFRKHLKKSPDGYVFTEFITQMNHGGKYNTISSALGHHINEGRWLRDTSISGQYIRFWLYVDKATAKPHLHAFSSWIDDAVYNYFLVHNDVSLLKNNINELVADYMLWEEERQLPDGKFWQFDVKDAMEESISGGRKEKNVRPTINSYMYGNAVAIAKMADILGMDSLKAAYDQKASALKSVVQDYLWNDTANFFEVRKEDGRFANAREELGYIPWYFNLPDDKAKYAEQWEQLKDTTGFCAPWGITTAERRHPEFRTHGSGHGCEWDGAVWPYATTQTLKGLSNLLTNYHHQDGMSKDVFYNELQKYAASHTKNGLPYLGEYQDEKTGYWLKGDNPRSSYYNHSGYIDLVINDLIGLKARADNVLEIDPLIPEGKWDWFALDSVLYHGKMISIIWDKDGKKYGKGKGFRIYVDGKQVYKSRKLKYLKVKL